MTTADSGALDHVGAWHEPVSAPRPGPRVTERKRLPGIEHLVPLPGTDYGVWPSLVLRGTGFPAKLVLALAAPGAVATTNEVLSAHGQRPLDQLARADREAVSAALQAGSAEGRATVRRLAQEPRLREAVTWQNRPAIRTGFDRLASKAPEVNNVGTREKEALVASYLQRYCTKNDTIGFFGPAGFGRIVDGPRALSYVPGAPLERRQVYFEQWCIDALAMALSADEELRKWAPPRLQPYFRLTAKAVWVPFSGPMELLPEQLQLLASLDGQTPARSIVARLVTQPGFGLSEEEAYQFLDRAAKMGMVAWDFKVPLQAHPGRALAAKLTSIEDPALGARARLPLERLERARERVAEAAGDPESLMVELERLEEEFETITGASSSRAHGTMYSARTLVYEDCRRGGVLEIGQEMLAKLGGPLGLISESARWLRHRMAERYRALIEEIFEGLSEGGAPVELLAVHKALAEREPGFSALNGPLSPLRAEIQDELLGRWKAIFAIAPGATDVHFRSADLAEAVKQAFGTEAVGWQDARYIAPDLMIAARGLEAAQRGEYQLVLGEVHLANTFGVSVFVEQYPDIRELADLVAKDMPFSRVIPAFPHGLVAGRLNHTPVLPTDYHYCFGPDPSPAPEARSLRIADLRVERSDRGLVVVHVDGRYQGEILEFMEQALTLLCTSMLALYPHDAHVPRITIDDVIVVRQSWTWAVCDLEFASAKDSVDRWLGAQALRRQHDLPRFVFIKTPAEPKPCFVDFDSPIYVEALARYVRSARRQDPSHRLRVVEMVPDFEHLWLEDQAGDRYASELRMVMVQAPGRTAGRA